MTVINPNSISGITSITLPSGDGNVLTIHTNDGTERFRIDSSGNVKVGSACTISQDGDVFFTGVCTATTLTGAASGLTGTLPAISGANLTNLPAANLTGALPAISGANLTGIAATDNVRTGILDVAGIATFRSDVNIPNINGGQIGGRRNLVQNGAMMVAQRGTSSTTNAYATIDRWRGDDNGTDEQTTKSQVDVASGTTPYTLGFRKAFRLTNGNQTSGAGTADHATMTHYFEAQNMSNSGWNYTSSSSFVTLSFWVKSSVAQNFYGYLRTHDGSSYMYRFETGSLSANTWTKITKTVPGNSNLQIDNDNGVGFSIFLSAYRGTDQTGSTTLNQWGAYDGTVRAPDYATTWWTTNDATFEITGVQLEVGSQATPFEHLSYGEELAICQRYYFRFLEGNNREIGVGWYYSGSHVSFMLRYPTTMRAIPTGTVTDVTNSMTIYRSGAADQFDTFTFENGSTEQYSAYNSSQVSGTAGQAGIMRSTSSAAIVEFSADI